MGTDRSATSRPVTPQPGERSAATQRTRPGGRAPRSNTWVNPAEPSAARFVRGHCFESSNAHHSLPPSMRPEPRTTGACGGRTRESLDKRSCVVTRRNARSRHKKDKPGAKHSRGHRLAHVVSALREAVVNHIRHPSPDVRVVVEIQHELLTTLDSPEQSSVGGHLRIVQAPGGDSTVCPGDLRHSVARTRTRMRKCRDGEHGREVVDFSPDTVLLTVLAVLERVRRGAAPGGRDRTSSGRRR